MADERKKASGDAQEPAASEASQVDLSNYVPKEDLQKLQSTKDREIAEREARLSAQAARLEAIESQMEAMISDPAAKAQFVNERLQAKLSQYEQREALNTQKNYFVEKYGVPLSAMAGATNASEVTEKAFAWTASKASEKTAPPKKASEDTEETDEEGEDKAPVSSPPSATTQQFTGTELDTELARLREIASTSKNRRVAHRARMDALKLERQRNQQRGPRRPSV